jgi:hypothetical protein
VIHSNSNPAKILKMGARTLSCAILSFWGLFMLAHLFGTSGRPSRPLTWSDVAILASISTSLFGLALAWWREGVGALVALVAFALCAALNWRVVVFPGALIPTTAMLFLASWWLGRSSRKLEAPSRRTA